MTATEKNLTIFIIEDDPLMAECLARAATHALLSRLVTASHSSKTTPTIKTFSDAVSAANALADGLPDLILLDVLLSGPDGFTFLNETMSYSDTAKIPVIIVTSLSLADRNLAHYGVRAVLNKDTMTPTDLQEAIQSALAQNSALAAQQAISLVGAPHAR